MQYAGGICLDMQSNINKELLFRFADWFNCLQNICMYICKVELNVIAISLTICNDSTDSIRQFHRSANSASSVISRTALTALLRYS